MSGKRFSAFLKILTALPGEAQEKARSASSFPPSGRRAISFPASSLRKGKSEFLRLRGALIRGPLP